MKKNKISKKIAKSIILKSQLLDGNNNFSTMNIIESLGYIQIDSIFVIERAHHHVLWSRNRDYSTEELNTLLKKKKVFEYWFHAASYLPMEDYRFCLPKMNQYRQEKQHWFKVDRRMMKFVKDRIKSEGPLTSKDFKSSKKTSGWYDWKPAKKALEQLFMDGTLMTKERKGFHKVYDLAENILPSRVSTKMPNEKEFAHYLIRKQLKAQGIATISEISYQRGTEVKKEVHKKVQELLEAKEILPIEISGVEENYFCFTENWEGVSNMKNHNKLNILSPFDNLVIQRKRLRSLFDFEYRLECYVPQHKRKFGYFCLPLLYGDQFIGLIDLKAHRRTKELHVLNQHIHGVRKRPAQVLKRELKKIAQFNGCRQVCFT